MLRLADKVECIYMLELLARCSLSCPLLFARSFALRLVRPRSKTTPTSSARFPRQWQRITWHLQFDFEFVSIPSRQKRSWGDGFVPGLFQNSAVQLLSKISETVLFEAEYRLWRCAYLYWCRSNRFCTRRMRRLSFLATQPSKPASPGASPRLPGSLRDCTVSVQHPCSRRVWLCCCTVQGSSWRA